MIQSPPVANNSTSSIKVTGTNSLCPKRKCSNGSASTSSVRSVSIRRRFTISFSSFTTHHVERDRALIDTKKRHTMTPEATEPVQTKNMNQDLQLTQKVSAIERTKLIVIRNLFHSTTPSEARREKRAISQWKNLTKELMYCDMLSSSDTSICSEGSDLLPARSSLIRQFILKELISTEESYLGHLHRVTTALLALPCAIQPLFGAFPRFIHLSKLLILGFNDPSTSVSDVFRKHEDDFEIYIRYACSFEKNRKRILRTEIQSPPFRDLIQQLATDKASDRLGLADYMIIPIQRIARYCLLLKGETQCFL